MDTKSSGWKAVVSFICFFLGGILLLVSIPLGAAGIYNWRQVTDAFESDYQNTWQIQRRLSYALSDLLNLAENGPGENNRIVDYEDPNLLYEVWMGGRRVYSTEQRTYLFTALPEGYNLLLHFDGTKVSVTRDGKEMDVYGDGIYRQSSGWDVPGYSNYPVRSEHDKQVSVYIAAPEVPAFIPGGGSNMYTIKQDLTQLRQFILWVCIIPAAGVVLFAIYIIMNKHKKRADMAIARATGRIWAEFKAVLAAAILLSILALRINYIYWPNSLFLLPLLILLYLYFNDLRYNGWHNIMHQSLCGLLLRLWRCAELKRPVEKRLQRRAVAAFAAMLPFALVTMVWGWKLTFTWAIYTTNKVGVFFVLLLGLAGLALLLVGYFSFRNGVADAHLVNEGMEEVIAERMKSERMKVELVANVSHDLKTPLTSIVSYVELLSREDGLSEHVNDYIKILGEKSERLKTMVQEVFEVSKAASGDLPLDMEIIDLCKLIRQTLADMEEPVERSGLTVREQLTDYALPICADGNRLYRVFQNLIQNALQYSLEGSRIYVTLESDGSRAVATVRNTSRDELPTGLDFTARFVRGDESRTDGGSGLGLSIAKTFTEACGGRFRIDTAADLFTATVEFPRAK